MRFFFFVSRVVVPVKCDFDFVTVCDMVFRFVTVVSECSGNSNGVDVNDVGTCF